MSVQRTGCAVQRGCSVHRGESMSTVGDIMSTVEVFSTLGGYRDNCGGRSLGKQLNLYGNSSVLNIPRCTHDIPHTHHGIRPVYSWYPPTVLNSPGVLMISPSVLNTPRCTQWYLPSVLNTPVYSTTSPRCTAQALCRVKMFVNCHSHVT